MDSGLYSAYSALLARTEALDSAASNLANANTSGFRAEREYFQEAVAGKEAFRSQLGKSINSFSVLGGNLIDEGQGALTPTGNPLDVAIQGDGFFAIQSASGIRYTRDGAFQRSSDGTLQTATGEPVLNTARKPIQMPTGDLVIASDGSLSVNGAIAGHIGIYSAPASELMPEGINRYKALSANPPRAIASSLLKQGSLESSNQNVIQGSLQVVMMQRQAEMMQKAVNVFSSSFDKAASEDLPRI